MDFKKTLLLVQFLVMAIPVVIRCDQMDQLTSPAMKMTQYHSYGDDEDDEGGVKGYHKTYHEDGDDGYKHLDKFHKKDGDSYGYKTYAEYGKAHKGRNGGGSKEGGYHQFYKFQQADDGGKKGGQGKKRGLYQVVENSAEGRKKTRDADDYDYGYYGDSGNLEGDSGDGYYAEDYHDGSAEHYISGETGYEGDPEYDYY